MSEQGFSAVVDSGVEQVFVTDTVNVADGVSLSEMEVALEAERSTADIDFDVAGSASDIIAHASDLSGASIVTVTDATGAGFVDAADGAALNALEVSLVSDDSQSDVHSNVEDSVAIASELYGAEDLELDGGNTTMAGAADIQSSGAYDAANSDYTITDLASAILGDTATVIDDGVSTINVDGPVGAGVGVQLGELEDASFETGFSADVNFNIVDDANDITAALSGDTTGAMDNAASLIASGGTAMGGQEASDIQGAWA